MHAAHLSAPFIKQLSTLADGRNFVRAEGVWVWDDSNHKYLDLIAARGALALGHHHPRLQQALRKTAEQKPYNFLGFAPNRAAAELARELAHLCGPSYQYGMLTSTPTDAVEAAMRLATSVTGRRKFAFCEGAMHGAPMSPLALMGERLPFGSLPELEEALRRKKIAALFLELIQSEGGVRMPVPEYVEAARSLCRKYKTLLVIDESQTGLGRTGRWLVSHELREPPDAIIVGHALGGGLVPIAATVTTEEHFKKACKRNDPFDPQTTAVGASALGCQIAREVLATMRDERLLENSQGQGQRLVRELRTRLKGHALVKEVRGAGLLVGIELGVEPRGLFSKLAPGLIESASRLAFGQWISHCLLGKGILAEPAHHRWNVLKLEPPLTIRAEEIERCVQAIAGVFEEYPDFGTVTREMTKQLSAQFFTRGRRRKGSRPA